MKWEYKIIYITEQECLIINSFMFDHKTLSSVIINIIDIDLEYKKSIK